MKNSAGKDSIHYKILTNRSNKDINLPGTSEHFTPKQPKIDYYDIFYMETRLRAMLDEILTPMQLGIKEDKIKYSQLRYDYDFLLYRMRELEQFAFKVGGKKAAIRLPKNVSTERSD